MKAASLIYNKKAKFEYTLHDEFVAGVVLLGHEVKSVRLGHGSLTGSFVQLLEGELFLVGSQLTPYSYADTKDIDPKRTRKLLVSKKELQKIQAARQEKGLTLVPIAFEVHGRFIKLRFATAKGKKEYEKRETIKNRQEARRIASIMKGR